jgi:two-component system response regulator VanR
VLIVEDEPLMADAIREGLRLEAIAADIAGDGDAALELLRFNAYDIAVLDRDIPGPSGDEIADRIVASGSGMPILMLTAADRLDDKATGVELGAMAAGDRYSVFIYAGPGSAGRQALALTDKMAPFRP